MALFGCASAPQRIPVGSLDYVVVGVSGFGTGPNGQGQPSGAHDNLPWQYGVIQEVHRLTHAGSRSEFEPILTSFQCQQGQQQNDSRRLVIMANSWGAARGVDLARRYHQLCGRETELFIMVDGIRKPLLSYGRRPVARRCVNYYQRLSTAKGRAIEGCENHDLSSTCSRGGLGDCHIQIEWDGTAAGRSLIYDSLQASSDE